MLELDAAFEKAQEIADQTLDNAAGITTEEDTKIQIITRFLTECLGWSFSDISAETKHENGYSDYILSNDGKPALLVEAKRIGSIEIGTTEKDSVRQLKIAGPGLKKAIVGIDQAAGYAAPNGLPVAVLTDGSAWIVFKTFIPGDNFKNKEAVVFPTLRAVLTDFSIFYDLVSKEQIGKKLYNPIFDRIHQPRLLLTRPLKAPISEDGIKITQKTDLAFDLDQVFSIFFTRLTGDGDEDLLIECFVETRESRIADFSLEKLTATVLGNMSPADKEVDKELANLIETTVEIERGHYESGQTIFIVGPTGAGKSTFLDRFFRKTLSDVLRRRCVVTRINCLDSTGREDTALNWITEVLINSLEAIMYQDGAPSWDELQGLYHIEYLRRAKGVDAQLYERDKQAFKEKFGEYLDQVVESDREGYLKRILADIVHNRKKLPIILIDNTDEFSNDFKNKLFQFAQSLRRHVKHCLLIFPITDKTAWSFSKTDIFGIYQSRSFFLPTPPPREIFRKRIDFLKDRLSGDLDEIERRSYFASRGIKVSIANMSGFAKVLESVFVDHEYTSKTIGELTNYNIRKTLSLSKRIITSSVFNIEELLSSFITGQPLAPNLSKFMNALMKGDFEVYKRGDNHEIFPVFQVDHEIRQSPLITLRILTLLDATRQASKTIDERHLSVQSIFDYFDAISCSESSVDRAILSLLEAGLVEPYDASVRDISSGQRLAISFSGSAHLRLALHNKVFFEQMALTTSIVDAEAAESIKKIYLSGGKFTNKMNDIRSKFLEYLISEDQIHMSIKTDLDQYDCQHELIGQLEKFGQLTAYGDDEMIDSLGGKFPDGAAKGAVSVTVDWYDPERGFGFVEVEGIEAQAFLHAEKLRENGIERVSDGDELICSISRNIKGFYVSKVHGIETDSTKNETVECTIIRIFPDRKYGFVRVLSSSRDAFFHYSLIPEADRKNLKEGSPMMAVIAPDKGGRGLQVKSVISLGSTGSLA